MEESKSGDNLLYQLPIPILTWIFCYLDIDDLLSLRETSQLIMDRIESMNRLKLIPSVYVHQKTFGSPDNIRQGFVDFSNSRYL